MNSEVTLLTSPIYGYAPAAIEGGLLDLFAPSSVHASAASERSNGHAALWRSDAIHRANNLAQLASSLAHVGESASRRWLTPMIAAETRRLSRIYEELAAEGEPSTVLPCAGLLEQVVRRLTLIFGHARNVTCIVSAQPVDLPADQRRALVLICSELVINALKYAFMTPEGGVVSVSLRQELSGLELAVEDNGIGGSEAYTGGHGGGLLDRLGILLGAELMRTAGRDGRGYRVSVLVPAISQLAAA